jgi:predicted O-methyltransferase YrrM
MKPKLPMFDEKFVSLAREAFNPFVPSSGTEHVALLLYSLVRMARPRTVVEYGPGYTTLFILRGLADNEADVKEERDGLAQKSRFSRGQLSKIQDVLKARGTADRPGFWRRLLYARTDWAIARWFAAGGKACGVSPGYYLEPYRARLFSFEQHAESHRYARRMKKVVGELELSSLMRSIHGAGISADAIPVDARPIDLAWNDDESYRKFFEEFWPLLNPRGGLMIFHSTPAFRNCWDDINWMREQRSSAGDLEVLTLPEPHKLIQNGCTILRRTTDYEPPFALQNPAGVVADLERFMAD